MDRNRSVARRVGRVLAGAGLPADLVEEGGSVGETLKRYNDQTSAVMLVGDAGSREAMLPILRDPAQRGRCVGVLYGVDEGEWAELLALPPVWAVLGPRGVPGGRLEIEGELLSSARHLLGLPLPPLQGQLLWGAQAFAAEVRNVAGREAAVARIVALCGEELGLSRRLADSAGEVVHELITNAMYDAPVDELGVARYATDRTAPIELRPEDRVTFRYGTDGLRLAVEVEDRFGGLRREDLAGSLRRGAAGQINHAAGGAGIGMSLVLRACQSLTIDVESGLRTRVTGVLDLDPPRPSEGAPRPGRSLIFPHRLPGGAGAPVGAGGSLP